MNTVVCFDLDDTLYKEVEYMKSAYKAIAAYAVSRSSNTRMPNDEIEAEAYQVMMDAYKHQDNAFEKLNLFLKQDIPNSVYLEIYRNHYPNITLSNTTEETLDRLKSAGCVMGLITDGRSIQQRNKIEVLGLEKWFNDEDIIISEEFGTEKPCVDNYKYFMSRYAEAKSFVYIGDNPKKDFLGANTLGWTTICLLDNGENIHRQDFEDCGEDNLPQIRIKSLSELEQWVNVNGE